MNKTNSKHYFRSFLLFCFLLLSACTKQASLPSKGDAYPATLSHQYSKNSSFVFCDPTIKYWECSKASKKTVLNKADDYLEKRVEPPNTKAQPLVLVHFSAGGWLLTDYSKNLLLNIKSKLGESKNIKLVGFTDVESKSKLNISLSRAQEVKKYLVSQGFKSERVKVFARGDCCHIANNLELKARIKNRRVEIYQES